MAKDTIAPYLLSLFNMFIKEGYCPPEWNERIMHLIYKGKGDTSDLLNYRGITVNNAIGNIFTSILNGRLSQKVEECGLLGNIQIRGREGLRTEDSLFILRTLIEKASSSEKSEDRDIALLFIDLSKAYDCVSHDLLWTKLSALGLYPDFL